MSSYLQVGFRRGFSTSAVASGRVGYSIIQPVHHKVKIIKSKLSPRFPELKYTKADIRSPRYRPRHTRQDRVAEHFENTLKSDLLLINYLHGEVTKQGIKRREWDGTSEFHINRPTLKPKGSVVQTKDVKPRTFKNIAKIESIVVTCYPKESKDHPTYPIAAALQLQQLTNCKPKAVYSKTDVVAWGVRRGKKMGAKVEIKGDALSQFISTLTELVLPRIREYRGISNSSGDKNGNISFGLEPEDIKFFPEIDANQDAWQKTFGVRIYFKTTAQTDQEARILLSAFGFPFYGSEKPEPLKA